jgi:hypothetical protein
VRHTSSNAADLVAKAKQRNKKRNRPFNITYKDIIIPAYCPILGVPLKRGAIGGSTGSPTLDRYDNNLGYTKDNTWVISYLANCMKSHATIDQLVKFSCYWINKYPKLAKKYMKDAK